MTPDRQELLLAKRAAANISNPDSDNLFQIIFEEALALRSGNIHGDMAIVREATILAKVINELGMCSFARGELRPVADFIDKYSMKLAVLEAGPGSANIPWKKGPSKLAQRFVDVAKKALEAIAKEYERDDTQLFQLDTDHQQLNLESPAILETLMELDKVSRLETIVPTKPAIFPRGRAGDSVYRILGRTPPPKMSAGSHEVVIAS